jgi:hypothetical protein
VSLKLTPEEIQASDWSPRQLLFLQTIYNAQQRRYQPLEYDIVRDSMIRLQEYVGIDDDAIADLIDAGILRHDTDHPHRLYSVAPDGREVIGESYREGVEYGHGEGDLEESAEHVLGIAVAERYLEQTYVDNPASPATELSPYHEITIEGTVSRLDLAALDDTGAIVAAVEVERLNHDYPEAVLDDFDKIAACDVDEAIWIVMSRRAGHELLEALNHPVRGPPRVEKEYSENTPPQGFKIDTAGLTAVYPVTYVRNQLAGPDGTGD